MLKARQGKEIVLRTANNIGALAAFSKIVAERGMNILAMSAWVEDDEAVVRLVTDDALRTMDVLRDSGYDPQQRDVVLVDAAHKAGILRHLTDTLSKETLTSHTYSLVLPSTRMCVSWF